MAHWEGAKGAFTGPGDPADDPGVGGHSSKLRRRAAFVIGGLRHRRGANFPTNAAPGRLEGKRCTRVIQLQDPRGASPSRGALPGRGLVSKKPRPPAPTPTFAICCLQFLSRRRPGPSPEVSTRRRTDPRRTYPARRGDPQADPPTEIIRRIAAKDHPVGREPVRRRPA